MSTTSIYLSFKNQTEEAFNFYKSVFGTEFIGEISRFGGMPQGEGEPPISEDIKNLVINVQLPILGGVKLMGADTPDGMREDLVFGNNVTITLETDTKEETEKYFALLSEGGKVGMPLDYTFWDAYYGDCTDKFGVHWNFNCPAPKK